MCVVDSIYCAHFLVFFLFIIQNCTAICTMRIVVPVNYFVYCFHVLRKAPFGATEVCFILNTRSSVLIIER